MCVGLPFEIEMLVCWYLSELWLYYCRIQPVYVIDVAGALIAALKDDGSSMGKIYELGGPEIFTVHELVIYAFVA